MPNIEVRRAEMPKEDYTDFTILLDRTGSMDRIKTDMEGGIKSYLRDQAKIPGGKVSLFQFDNPSGQHTEDAEHAAMSYEVRIRTLGFLEAVFIAQDLDVETTVKIDPRGSTPLRDAFWLAIKRTEQRLLVLSENERPYKIIFVVITDGLENASMVIDASTLKTLVLEKTERKWEFVYLGANQEAIETAQEYGISAGNAMNFSPDGASVNLAMVNISEATTRSRSGGGGDTSKTYFNEDEQEARTGKP